MLVYKITGGGIDITDTVCAEIPVILSEPAIGDHVPVVAQVKYAHWFYFPVAVLLGVIGKITYIQDLFFSNAF